MTPKEKAKKLINKFYTYESHPNSVAGRRENAKKYALIAVDEILSNDSVGVSCDDNFLICDNDYWQKVKQEINNL
jgi:hypothetical protein